MLAQSQAQNFAPIGAKWYYTRGKTNNLNTMEVISDTLINNLPFKKVKVISFQDNNTKRLECFEYLWGNNDSILYYNYYHNQVFKLYDFSKKTGDTMVVHEGKFKATDAFQSGLWDTDSIVGLKYLIDQVDSVLINQKHERRQIIKQLGSKTSNWRLDTRSLTYAINRIGSSGYFWGGFVGGAVAESDDILRCYSDSNTSYKNPYYLHPDCNLITGIKYYTPEMLMKVYPNPCNHEFIFIDYGSSRLTITFKITDITGQLVSEGTIKKGANSVKVDSLSPGVYILSLRDEQNSFTQSIKIVKTNE